MGDEERGMAAITEDKMESHTWWTVQSTKERKCYIIKPETLGKSYYWKIMPRE
jgi:hypothetical protein